MYQRIFYNIPISFLVQFYKQFAFNFLSRNFIFSQQPAKTQEQIFVYQFRSFLDFSFNIFSLFLVRHA